MTLQDKKKEEMEAAKEMAALFAVAIKQPKAPEGERRAPGTHGVFEHVGNPGARCWHA